MKHNRSANGISLLEAIFILIVIAVIALGTVSYIRQATSQTHIDALLSEIQGVIAASVDYNDAQGSFDNLSVNEIVAMHTIVPRYNVVAIDQKTATAELIDPWTGLSAGSNGLPPGIIVSPINPTQQGNQQIQINIEQLPAFACEQVLTQLSSTVTILDPDNPTQPSRLSIQDLCISLNTKARQSHTGVLGASVFLRYPKDASQ